MALIRFCTIAALCVFVNVLALAQKVYYPADASQLLKSTADDVAALLQRAGAGKITPEPYTTLPANGLILIYDASIIDNQSCRVKSDGSSFIQFRAAEDNGLNFGVYQYLYQLGFRFYQPGTIWEVIPTVFSPYKKIDTVYTCGYKYRGWAISGGHNNWAMDKDPSFYWDTYGGEQGHQWSLYQRRNNMRGSNRFAGHRDDILTNEYVATLQKNPCYVAPYNGTREATRQSVPDINNVEAMQFWATAIEQQFTGFKNNIFSKPAIYSNYIHNFSYNYSYLGIEVPDGSHWANSKDNIGCGTNDYLKESDQHFTLANFTAAKINSIYPGKRFQLYAYDGHADVPSNKININENIDVQVVPTAFQLETSSKGLLNRWYARSKNISEYHYLNLPQWSGETPSFYLDDLKTSVKRIKEQQSQGIVWETSPAKFASLPFLLAANAALKDDLQIDSVLLEFCNAMFQDGGVTVYKLLQCWGDDKTVTVTNGIQDNKYKLPYYFKLVQQAERETQNSPAIVKERLGELKAYLHYMVLYYNWSFDQPAFKSDKAAALCLYLAKVNKLQIVNSYFLIQDIVWKYNTTDDIYIRFNPANGTAYQNGSLLPITPEEIDANFAADAASQTSSIKQFSFKAASEIQNQFATNNLEPVEKINVKINYTYGKDYGSRSEFYFIANSAGNFSIKFKPTFDFPNKGYINFTVEATDKTLGIIKDFSMGRNNDPGIISVSVPGAGIYKLSIVSKYKTAIDIVINTNGYYFYKNGPYLGNTVENYRGDLLSLPGYFYVPGGINRIYFSLNNSYSSTGGFASAEEVSKAFAFKDDNGAAIEPKLVSQSDSALFYLDISNGGEGTFLQAFKMEQYRLCFSNITNIQWYARKKVCTRADFTASIKNISGKCITSLQASSTSDELKWEVYDALLWHYYGNIKTVDLPENISPNAIVTLYINGSCLVTKRIGDDPGYLKQKSSCATGAPVMDPSTKIVVYPNPGNGTFRCMQNGEPVLAEDIQVYNVQGSRLASFTNTQRFNIIHLPAGMYLYSIRINKINYTGKLIKI